MVNGAFALYADASDFGLEQGDPFVELVDRIGIEVLPGQLRHQIVLATRQIFVGVHAGSVDRGQGDVNKASGSYGARKNP